MTDAKTKRTEPLPLERYATLAAELDVTQELSPILEREKVEKELWLATQAHWLKRMADEAHRKRFETTNRYQTLFNAKRKSFDARAQREKKRRERPPLTAPPVEVLAAAAAELAAPLTTSHGDLAFPPPPSIDPITARDAAPAPGRAVPFAPAPAPAFADVPQPARVAAPAPVPPAAPEASDHRFGTMAIPLGAIEATRSATPFHAGDAARQPGPAVAEPPKPRRDLGATWSVDDGHRPPEAIPFRAPPPPPPSSPAIPEGPSASTTVPLDLDDDTRKKLRDALPLRRKTIEGTLDPNAFAGQGRGSLPFEPKPMPAPPPPAPIAPSPPAASASDDDDDSPRTKLVDAEMVLSALAKVTPFAGRDVKVDAGPPEAKDSDEDEAPRTMAFDTSSAAGLPSAREPLPFSGPGAPAAAAPRPGPAAATATGPASPAKQKRFSINVFASLTAEIAESPNEAEAIRARYGVTEAEHKEESMRWTEEFQRSDETRQRYFGIVQRYRGYIQQRKRG